MFKKIEVPKEGTKIEIKDGKLVIPDDPIIPYIIGDGIGPDILKAAMPVFDAGVAKAYGGKRKVVWMEIFAGERAKERYGEVLPEDTFNAVREFIVAIKGPLTTPVGGGYRSLNVTLRQTLDLYACVRPVKYYRGVPSPVKHPERMNMIIFRENTEDVYAGIEWRKDTPEVKKIIDFLNKDMGCNIRQDSGIGIKPISEFASKRLVKKAIQHAIDYGKKSVTLVHKGNIMKYTEGAFRDWGYELAKEEFPDVTITEAELWDKYDGKQPEGKIVINDRIADSMLQQILTRTNEYSVIALTNLNGDYLSDACAAQVGGLGLAPGGNIGDYLALFEATHGTAPKYTGMDKVNPSSLILSGAMMFEYLNWREVSDLIKQGLERSIMNKTVTYDLERQMEGATKVRCSEFGRLIVENMG